MTEHYLGSKTNSLATAKVCSEYVHVSVIKEGIKIICPVFCDTLHHTLLNKYNYFSAFQEWEYDE